MSEVGADSNRISRRISIKMQKREISDLILKNFTLTCLALYGKSVSVCVRQDSKHQNGYDTRNFRPTNKGKKRRQHSQHWTNKQEEKMERTEMRWKERGEREERERGERERRERERETRPPGWARDAPLDEGRLLRLGHKVLH